MSLALTAVDDGAGLPASYDIRVAPAPLDWGSATGVSLGSCAAPVTATAVGSTISCDVLGLLPATAYEFQAVAFRGTLDVDAVFGDLSNVAAATTTSTQPGTVQDLAVSGTTDSTATLTFTEVNNGKGLVASYDVRFAVAPLDWGSANVVEAARSHTLRRERHFVVKGRRSRICLPLTTCYSVETSPLLRL